ncbi:MAG: carboxypeptidase regulatory-like domain-containing protein [bacterium]
MRLPAFLLLAAFARLTNAQTPDTTHRASGASVSGVVQDSIARTVLAGAMVQLVAADSGVRFGRSAISDSLGRFVIDDVPDGRYTLGFFHPMLDSLGVAPPLREVVVNGRKPVTTALAIPSPMRLRSAICGAQTATDSSAGGVLVGIVRNAADGAPIAGVTVIGDWLEVTLSVKGTVRRVPRLVATTAENGWFAMCNVPSGGMMGLIASHGADSTDRIDVQVPTTGFVRRELYLGPTRTVVADVVRDSAQRADSSARAPRRVHMGDGRLSGTVVTAVDARPLRDAQVSITDGPTTRTNERGEWTLADAPAGTRMLEVRAVGYYPDHRRVDVVAGALPLRIQLSTLKAVLDTVRITASRLTDRHLSGFEERRRTGNGHYLVAADIAQRRPLTTTDIFRAMSGVRVDGPRGDTASVLVRGTVADWCQPSIFLDGHLFAHFNGADLDNLVSPEQIAAIEVYTGTTAPPQWQQGMSGCGSIVIWTK